ncbi:MAG: hypothetical protein HN509_13545 [Halobacteriovoraceae bacterium]|jgi:hypothetical protein|nr:hypothetical protein [Halobacteriovoraceae bacterium]MBT5094442.1 hypothetical protein [Halobacteriovoraceae bacterium]
MARILTKAIAPTQILLVVLFFILGIGEFLDGIYDVGDFAVPFLMLLALNNIYLTNFKENQPVISELPVQKRSPQQRGFRILINGLFFTLLFSPFLFELLELKQFLREGIFQVAFIIWSGAFLGISIVNFKKSLGFARFVYCNIAFAMLITSLVMI